MNQRIRELAEQADATVLGTMTGGKQYTFLEHDLEKFAELIVREFIVDFYRNHLDTTSNEDITVQVERFVRDRFGVAE
jgi:hypothetical protein